ncbi:MAG: Ig domain-containing protein [Bacteroidales bacterium]|nr:Ig domain-containing protein [Bacteroidales bacterium]
MKKIIALAALLALFAGCKKDGGKSATVELKGIQLEKEISVFRGETATLKATLVPSDATADITWESSDAKIVTVSDGKLTGVAVGKATVTAKSGSIKADCAVTILPPKGAVDLGMELTRADGTTYKLYWAECNLGAEKPEDYGDYYAWGEVDPYYSSQDPLTWKDGKSAGYDWASYKWCNGASNKLTKYCLASNTDYWDGEGTPDGKTVLDPEDDAAHVQLGGKWRMPTRKEMEALCALKNNEDYTWEHFGEVSGIRITCKSTGVVLLLPAAGYCDNTSISLVKSAGLYWSATGYTGGYFFNVQDNASSLSFMKDATLNPYGTGYNPRNRGFSIRPVTE